MTDSKWLSFTGHENILKVGGEEDGEFQDKSLISGFFIFVDSCVIYKQKTQKQEQGRQFYLIKFS